MNADDGVSGRSWSSFPERGAYIGLKIMLALYAIGGMPLFRPLSRLVAGYFLLADPAARRASREYLRRLRSCWPAARPDPAPPPSPGSVWRHFSEFSYAMLDKLRVWRGDLGLEQIDHVNRELFDARRAAGRGGIWITSHLGNMEVCRALTGHAGFRMTVLVHTKHALNFNRLIEESSGSSTIDLVQVESFDLATAMRLKSRIERGEFIAIVGDRTPVGGGGRVVSAPFLGRRANFPLGPFLLATLLGCPVGTLFCVATGAGRFRLMVDDLPGLQNAPRADRRVAIEAAVAEYAARLEHLCFEYPFQWFNFFSFWTQPGVEQWPRAATDERP